MFAAGFCAALAPVTALAAGGAPAETPPDDRFANYEIAPAPSFRAFPADMIAAMRRRILERRGELPAPVSAPDPEAEHGSGH